MSSAQRNGSTRKWKATRARMLRQLPAVCELCGKWMTDPAHVDVDHIIPIAYGGTDDPANLRLAHSRCNRGRRVVKVMQPASPTTPTDETPGWLGRTWSRHWSGGFDLRCGECRRLGHACPDADPPDLAA